MTEAAGHLDRHTPPTSPATLHYRGASFDVVNPHQSFLLGSNDIETPGEIDNLLDEYFTASHSSSVMPYDDITGEMPSEQQSLQNMSSSSRQRVLYDDPDSARRTILRIQNNASNHDVVRDPWDATTLRRDISDLSLSTTQRQGETAAFDASKHGAEDHNSNPLRGRNEGPSLQQRSNTRSASRTQRNEEAMTAVNRGSSLYPHSQISDRFPLTVSDTDEDSNLDNIDSRLEDEDPFYHPRGAHFDQEEDFEVYEDGAHADAYVPSSCRSCFLSALTICFCEQDPTYSRARKHRR